MAAVPIVEKLFEGICAESQNIAEIILLLADSNRENLWYNEDAFDKKEDGFMVTMILVIMYMIIAMQFGVSRRPSGS